MSTARYRGLFPVVPTTFHEDGTLDLDSPHRARFDQEDVRGCLELARVLAPRLA